MIKPIYPDIVTREEVFNGIYHIELTTYIRKEYAGKWYLIPITKKGEWGSATMEMYKKEFRELFVREVYYNLICFIINDRSIHWHHAELDTDQRSERDRITKLLRG